jgi:hypothetical protein
MSRRLGPLPHSWVPIAAVFAIVTGIGLCSGPVRAGSDSDNDTLQRTSPHEQEGSRQFRITTLSSRDDLISGGSVLVRIDVSSGIPLTRVAVSLNGADVTPAFGEEPPASHTLLGLVKSLRLGDNTLVVRDQTQKNAWSELTLTNHPITGPILSGPHIEPYECRLTQNGLGAQLDADCSAAPIFRYFYRSSSKTFKALTDPTGPRPADLVSTTTTDGRTVPYIVLVESGTVNRGVYHIAILDDPQSGSTTGPFKPGSGWNGKLIFQFGCCGSAQYNQGVLFGDTATVPGSVLSDNELSRGFALVNSTEMFNNQHANPHLQAETLMMLKEYFIKNYGVPKWTAGTGGSGGAIQQYLVTELSPGLLDGLQPSVSFPETMMPAVWECRLLNRVYAADPATWTTAKQNAVNGFNTGTCRAWDLSFANIIVADNGPGCGLMDPADKPYDPITNPTGPRCDFFDTNANLLGRDAETGFSNRPTDNVGVQYGLNALNLHRLSTTEFLELNALVGGFDVDGHPQPQRMVADEETLERVYRGGFVNSFMGGGLTTVPIITQRTNVNSVGDIHDQLEDQIIRARLIKANGRADNQIIWRSGSTSGVNMAAMSLDLMNQWLDNMSSDPSPLSTQKVVRNKLPGAADTCWDLSGNKIVEQATLAPDTQCNTIYPYFTQPQLVAGQGLTKSVLKCHLKPVNFKDYNVTFTPTEQVQLRSIFPNGVCDYSKPGVGEEPLLGTYLKLSSDSDRDEGAPDGNY